MTSEQRKMEEFREVLDECRLVDIDLLKKERIFQKQILEKD